MNILHIGLASKYTEGMAYQDNQLPDQNVKDGHIVTYISDCYKFINGILIKTLPEDKVLSSGIRLIRVPHVKIFCDYVSEKVRAVNGIYQLIETIKPDVILFHGAQAYSLMKVAKYKRNHPEIKFYIDSHEDYNNSATNWISKYILHRLFYKWVIRRSVDSFDKVLVVSHESGVFLNEMYGIPWELMENYPLGGIILSEDDRLEKRMRVREKLGLEEFDILLLHTGKMDELKRTREILRAFSQVKRINLKLALIGSITEKIKFEVDSLIENDNRISYLGWKNSQELVEYLCASDLYIQLGSQSATLQLAMCCQVAVAVYPALSYQVLLNDTAFYIKTEKDLIELLMKASDNPKIIENKRIEAYELACKILDYKVLASRLYE